MFKKLLATGALALFTLTSTVFAAGAADVTPPANVAAQAIIAPATISPQKRQTCSSCGKRKNWPTTST